MDNSRDFKGIWIPKWVWLNEEMTIMEKMFYVEINSLDNSEGCFASNTHFSQHFNLSKNRCTEIIKSLEKKKMVSVKLIKKQKRVIKRIIKIVPIRKTEHPYSENRDYPIRKTEHPYSENRDGNNTNTNNTKERETRAIDFLKKNFPSRFEQEFLMPYSKRIKDLEKFILDYNDTVDQEQLDYTDRVLFSRLGKYARNWIENQGRYQKEDTHALSTRKRLDYVG